MGRYLTAAASFAAFVLGFSLASVAHSGSRGSIFYGLGIDFAAFVMMAGGIVGAAAAIFWPKDR